MPEVGKAMEEVIDTYLCKTTKHILIQKAVILGVFQFWYFSPYPIYSSPQSPHSIIRHMLPSHQS